LSGQTDDAAGRRRNVHGPTFMGLLLQGQHNHKSCVCLARSVTIGQLLRLLLFSEAYYSCMLIK